MDNKTIIESYKEHTFELERYDIKYVEIGSDNFDFDTYERDNAIYTGEFEKIPCIETGKFLIFRR